MEDLLEDVVVFLENYDCEAGVRRCLANVYNKGESGQYQWPQRSSIHCTRRDYSCPLQQEEGPKLYCNSDCLLRQMQDRR